jgi:malonate transporter
MLAILAVVLPVFTIILIGWIAGRTGLLPTAAVPYLNGFTIQLALPMLLFQFVAEADWPTLWQPGLIAALGGGVAIVFGLTLLLARRDRPMADRAGDALAAAYGNGAFIGIPIVQGLFGTAGLAVAIIASLITVCVVFAFAILLIEIDVHRDKGAGPAARAVLASLARNPMIIGPAAGTLWALTGLDLPEPVHRIASLIGGTASPVALVTIGLFLAETAPAAGARVGIRAVAPLILLKLVGQPLATFALVLAFGVPRPWASAAILFAALPTGTGPFMLAQVYDRDAGAIAHVILLTTLLSVLTVTLLARALV